MRKHIGATIALGFTLALASMPGAAYAATMYQPATPVWDSAVSAQESQDDEASLSGFASDLQASVGSVSDEFEEAVDEVNQAQEVEREKTAKLLEYSQADLEAIGSQEKSGHSICCPSYACAYADAVLDGTVHDHEYYTCSCCTWTDWGGGDSSDRYVGTDEQLLREAYDQIAAGKPTVIHVSWSGGEHWIALIGYENVSDPDHLSLSNFIALDPWDGAQLNAGSKYSLYGDGCEHISSR